MSSKKRARSPGSPSANDGSSHEFRRKMSIQYAPKEEDANGGKLYPTNSFVTPLLTDMYQLTMAYSYWRNKKHEEPAVFDLYFRKNPFKGEFTVFAGLEEVVRFVSSFRFSEHDISIVRKMLPTCDEGYFDWLRDIDCSKIKLYAQKEGSVCFPKVPLIRVEGPVGVAQLLETTLLCLVNYASLVATNAARHRLAAGKDKTILEFGLRRAQGPDGGISASRYTFMGGCDGTSNVLAGGLFNIPVKGTHAHSFVASFTHDEVLSEPHIEHNVTGKQVDLAALVKQTRTELGFESTNTSELTAFTAYALSFPAGFLGLVDTYDTLKSGLLNFLCLAVSLHKCGYKALGIRLDSGDLAYLSREARALFKDFAAKQGAGFEYMASFTIVASNDINEKTLLSLNSQGHEIDVFGIGTHLVTCQAQPALGCVFKLVEMGGVARIKLSNDIAKVTIPGRKNAYRLYSKDTPIVDIIQAANEPAPQVGERILCKHPFNATKRAYVSPSKVVDLLDLVWDGTPCGEMPTIRNIKKYCQGEIDSLRGDHVRQHNPTPYKVSVSERMYDFLHCLWQKEAPISTLCE